MLLYSPKMKRTVGIDSINDCYTMEYFRATNNSLDFFPIFVVVISPYMTCYITQRVIWPFTILPFEIKRLYIFSTSHNIMI